MTRHQVLPIGPPASPAWQIGRGGDIQSLANSLQAGDHRVLSGPRRTGKSTVALGALDVLSRRGLLTRKADLTAGLQSGSSLARTLFSQLAGLRPVAAGLGRKAERTGWALWRILKASG